jgi:hypothetical protein
MKYKASSKQPEKEGVYFALIWTYKGNIRAESQRIHFGEVEAWNPYGELWLKPTGFPEAPHCTNIHYLTALS